MKRKHFSLVFALCALLVACIAPALSIAKAPNQEMIIKPHSTTTLVVQQVPNALPLPVIQQKDGNTVATNEKGLRTITNLTEDGNNFTGVGLRDGGTFSLNVDHTAAVAVFIQAKVMVNNKEAATT